MMFDFEYLKLVISGYRFNYLKFEFFWGRKFFIQIVDFVLKIIYIVDFMLQVIYVFVDDLIDFVFVIIFVYLDVIIVLFRGIVELGIYLVVDFFDFNFRILDVNVVGERYYRVVRGVQKILQVCMCLEVDLKYY